MTKYPKAGLKNGSVSNLNWMSGAWKSKFREDPIEEHWSDLDAGTMMGMFRWQKNNKIWFFEFLTIELEEDGYIYMRIKHFYPRLKGWEEKNESKIFLLVSILDSQAIFLQIDRPDAPWLIYRREGQKMTAYFETENSKPTIEECLVFYLIK